MYGTGTVVCVLVEVARVQLVYKQHVEGTLITLLDVERLVAASILGDIDNDEDSRRRVVANIPFCLWSLRANNFFVECARVWACLL